MILIYSLVIKVLGSFTGIRIGISTIKAFSDVTNKQCIGISSLLALAYNVNYNGYICSLIDAKNDNAYYGLFNYTNGTYTKILDYSVENISSIAEILKKYNNSIFFVGNGSIVYKHVIESILEEKAIFPSNEISNYLTATSVGIAAFDNISNTSKEFSISPLYIRKSSAEKLLEEKQNGNSN